MLSYRIATFPHVLHLLDSEVLVADTLNARAELAAVGGVEVDRVHGLRPVVSSCEIGA